MKTRLNKILLSTLPLAGLLFAAPVAFAHDPWDHERLHNELNEEHGEFHGELGDLHREFHEYPHSAWEHRRFHRDLDRLHRDVDRGFAEEHRAYHGRDWAYETPYARDYDDYYGDNDYDGGWYSGDESWRYYDPNDWRGAYQGW